MAKKDFHQIARIAAGRAEPGWPSEFSHQANEVVDIADRMARELGRPVKPTVKDLAAGFEEVWKGIMKGELK